MRKQHSKHLSPILALTLGLTLLVGGCSGYALPSPTPSPSALPATPAPTTQPETVFKVIASEIEREAEPDVPREDLVALVAGQNAFAFDLYRAIRTGEHNLFYSPHSIGVALAMTYAGARGETAEQMATVLHFDLPQEQLHPAMNALAQQLTQPQGLTLTVANSLWAQDGYPFRDDFLAVLARNYGAGVQAVDYVDPDAREAAREAINRWVEEETDDKIEELIKDDMLTDRTRLVLANAIYFNAKWEQPFRHGTQDGTFYLLDGSEITVPMMGRRATTPYAQGPAYQAVALPYQGGRIQMVVVLPEAGSFDTVEANLDADFLGEVLDSLVASDVKLYLPRFSYDAELVLKDTLGALGMPDAFDPNRADFSGMDDTQLLYLSHVVHKAFVAVDEEGTEAAAATGVVVEIESMPTEVRVERPFIFFIHDTESGLVLFAGRVMNPGT